MGWVLFYSVLAFAFVVTIFLPSANHISAADILKGVVGAATAITSSVQALARANLRVYLFQQRLRLRFSKDESSIWIFAQRLDDLDEPEPLTLLQSALTQEFKRWNPQVLSKGPRQFRLILDRTIHLKVQFTPADESEDSLSHITVESDPIEMGYRLAARKIDDTIVPILSSFQALFRPMESSLIFEVDFKKSNPFFTFYVEHLKADQVKNFNLVFRPDISRTSEKDQITVTQQRLEIAAGSIDAFGRLIKAFLLLSSEVDSFTRGQNA